MDQFNNTKEILLTNIENETLINSCRTCLKKKVGMRSLLDNSEETNLLLGKIASILNSELKDKRVYPPHLCKPCEKKVISTFEFREQCEASKALIDHYWENQGCRNIVDIDKVELPPHFNLNEHNSIIIIENGNYSEIIKLQATSNIVKNSDLVEQDGIEGDIQEQENASLDVNIETNNHNEIEMRKPQEVSKRNNSNQRMRLKQYDSEDVNRVVKRVREKLYRHVICIFCEFKAISNRTLSVHVSRVHSEYKGVWCAVCNCICDNLVSHTKDAHYEDLKCPFCNKIQSNMGHFMEHMASHSGTRLHKCTFCDKSFISQRHLKTHIKKSHDVVDDCKVCQYNDGLQGDRAPVLHSHNRKCSEVQDKYINEEKDVTSNAQSMDDDSCLTQAIDTKLVDLDKISAEPQNYCNVCDKKVKSLSHHNDMCHSIVPKAPKEKNLCPHCGKQFRTKAKLNVHIRVHTGETPYKCQYCDKRLTTKNILVSHERTHTGEKPYTCTICGKSFAQSSVLNTHVRIHTGRPEQCKICEKRFCRPAELRLHMRKHTGEKPYSCNLCDQRFYQKCHLVEHVKRHSDDRPFKCNICEKAFKNTGTLKCHLQIHTGDKPYKCSQCSYACRQPYSLTQHMQQHDDDKPQPDHPHTCEVCQKRFTTVAHLTTHCNRFHAHLNLQKIVQIEQLNDQPEHPTTNIQFQSETLDLMNQSSMVMDNSPIQVVESSEQIQTVVNSEPKFDSVLFPDL